MNGTVQPLYAIGLLGTMAAYLALAVLVVRSRPVVAYARLWTALCLALAVLYGSMLLATSVPLSMRNALIASRAGMTAGVATCVLAVWFALSFAGQARRRWWLLLALGAAALVLIGLFWGTRLLVAGVGPYIAGVRMPRSGPLMPLYGAYCVGSGVVAVSLLVTRFRRARGHERLQLGYMLVAFAILVLAALGTLLPVVTHASLLVLLPSVLMILAPSLITYAIIRHALWDIRTVVHRTAAWLGASMVVLIPVVLLLWQLWPRLSTLGRLNAAVLGALALHAIFALHFRVLQPFIDHHFARGHHDPARVVEAFTQDVVNLRGLRELAQLIRGTIASTLYVDRVRLWVDAGAGLRDVQDGEPCPFPQAVRERLARRQGPVVRSARAPVSAEEAELNRVLEREGVDVALALVDNDQLLGLLALAGKRELRAYTRDDLHLLETIRPAAAVALANSLLYDQLQELTSSLEMRVEQRTQELEQANTKLRLADQQKNEFFANITHELRTPLTLILAPLEDLVLRRGQGEVLLSESDLEAMHRNAVRLLRQINDLLDLARLDAGQLRLKLRRIAANAPLAEAARAFSAIGRRQRVSVSFTPCEGDDSLVIDPGKLELVVGNLMANAVKFTPEGGEVELALEREGDWLVVVVRDTGIGIPRDQLTHIFDRFAQVEQGATRRYEGAGIGLSLVREMVALHGGEISVSSRQGEGSEFRVRLRSDGRGVAPELIDRREVDVPVGTGRRVGDGGRPVWRPLRPGATEAWVDVADQLEPDEGGAPERPRLMVVEDNADMRDYLVRRLSSRYGVEAFGDGASALQRAQQRPPDVVVADVMMPELSGYELCRQLKDARQTAAVPVILLTARKGADRTLEGFRAGADDYLTKPFNIHELLARIEVHLRLAEMGRQLARQEKSSALNLVAAGLAHEVRNPVNAIINAVRPLMEGELLNEATEEAVAARQELLAAVLDSGERIERLCSDLLGVTRTCQEEMSDWDIEEALDATVRLVSHKRGYMPQVERELRHGTPVFGRTAQLNQVLLNLIDNAVRAAGVQGRLWVRSERVGQRFRLVVRDSGPGIATGTQERIFDPLYSTHAHEGASGLGLHVCRRIIREHDGTIGARNHPDGGAELVVELPAADADWDAAASDA